MSKSLGKYVYNEQNLIGQGAFGKVYRGINTSTNEEVAVKVQSLRNIKPHVLEALKNEADIMKCLHHPHLVQLHDVFDFEDKKIFVMELCKGDLQQVLKKRQLSEIDVHNIIQQLIAGFKELVRLGLLHRDIKPANCFENNGIYKLGDFGAIVEADYTNKKLMKLQYGTMAYESPQMLNREKYSTKCDVWSLGILCYEMLYNEKPWICISEGQYVRAMKSWPVRFPLTKRVSDQYKDFISKCLVYQEKGRMSWDEVFEHPWLHSIERTYCQQESFEKEIIKQLRETSELGSFNPLETFKNYDIDNKGVMDLRKFELFLAHFDPRITKQEISMLFSQLSKDNQLNKQEFQNIFIQNVIN